MRSLIESLESRTHLSLPGDANQDGRVDSLDFSVVALNYNQHPRTLAQGDFTDDARVNSLDFNVLAGNFGRFEMAEIGFDGADSTDLNANAAWVGGVKPGPTDIAKFDFLAMSNVPDTNSGLATIGGLKILNGDGASFIPGLDTVTVNGNADVNGISTLTLAALSGNLTGTGNTGQILITLKTGTGKTINNDASSGIDIVSLGTVGTPASVTIGASVAGGGLFIDAIPNTASSITWTTTSQGGSPAFGCNGNASDLHGTFISNKTSGACAVNADGITLPADATFTSQLNGVTVTDGTGGTFSTFTQLRTAAAQAKYATVTGGVEKSHAQGTVLSGTYSQAFGFVPAGLLVDGFGSSSDFSASAGSWSMTLDADGFTLGSHDLALTDLGGTTILNLDTITVTAAASNTPQTRLDYGFGLGFGFIRSANKRELLRR